MSDHLSFQQTDLRLSWKNATGARGVPRVARAPFSHTRHEPCADLSPFLEHYWHVTWDLPRGVEYMRVTLPHPSVHLVYEYGTWQLYGVQTNRFARTLQGCDQVFGVKFRPGMFRSFWGQDVAMLTDRMKDGTLLFAGLPNRLPVDLALLQTALLACRPAIEPSASTAHDLVTLIASDSTLLQAEQVSRAAGLPLRTLHRLFRAHVGVGPKWIIRRYRLHEALARIDADCKQDWAAFALELGYVDRAHFINDFRKLIGVSPANYQVSQ